eukprot:COSAG05_NODE_1093_length_5913_cov_38.151703_3_plen_734_part_00
MPYMQYYSRDPYHRASMIFRFSLSPPPPPTARRRRRRRRHSAKRRAMATMPLRRVACGAQKGTYAMQMCATADGCYMGLVCSDNFVRVYDLQATNKSTASPLVALARLPGQCRGHADRVNDLAPHGPSGLVSASSDATARVWDARTGQCIATYEAVQYGEPVPLLSACANASATLVATGGEGGLIQLWDTALGALLHLYTDLHSEDITRLRFQPVWPTATAAETSAAAQEAAQSRLVSAGEDGLMCITDVREPDIEEALIDCWSIGTCGIGGGGTAIDNFGFVDLSEHGALATPANDAAPASGAFTPHPGAVWVLSADQRLELWSLQPPPPESVLGQPALSTAVSGGSGCNNGSFTEKAGEPEEPFRLLSFPDARMVLNTALNTDLRRRRRRLRRVLARHQHSSGEDSTVEAAAEEAGGGQGEAETAEEDIAFCEYIVGCAVEPPLSPVHRKKAQGGNYQRMLRVVVGDREGNLSAACIALSTKLITGAYAEPDQTNGAENEGEGADVAVEDVDLEDAATHATAGWSCGCPVHLCWSQLTPVPSSATAAEGAPLAVNAGGSVGAGGWRGQAPQRKGHAATVRDALLLPLRPPFPSSVDKKPEATSAAGGAQSGVNTGESKWALLTCAEDGAICSWADVVPDPTALRGKMTKTKKKKQQLRESKRELFDKFEAQQRAGRKKEKKEKKGKKGKKGKKDTNKRPRDDGEGSLIPEDAKASKKRKKLKKLKKELAIR